MSKKYVRNMTYTAILTAVLCVLSPLSVPIGAVPMTLGTLAVCIVSSVTGIGTGVVAVVLYVLLGAFGLPVFSSFQGGFHMLAGATGGYIVGYIPMALVIGLLLKVFRRKVWSYPIAMAAGVIVCYFFGTIWFSIQSARTFMESLTVCVLPFIGWDCIKIVLACAIVVPVYKAVSNQFGI